MFSTQMVNTNYLQLVRIKFVAGFRVRVCSDVAFLSLLFRQFFFFYLFVFTSAFQMHVQFAIHGSKNLF